MAPPKQFVYHSSRVGKQYQASIPRLKSRLEIFEERVSQDRDEEDEEVNADKLLWQPSKIDEEKVLDYLRVINFEPSRKNSEEKVLYLLHQCEYDVEEALERYKNLPEPRDRSEEWDKEDRKKFEKFLCVYGKKFNEFKKTRCPEKSVDEIVDYYYFWKTSPFYKEFITEFKGMRGWSRAKMTLNKKKVEHEVITLD